MFGLVIKYDCCSRVVRVWTDSPAARTWRRIASTHSRTFAMATGATALIVLGNLVEPLLIRHLVDRAVLSKNTAVILPVALAWCVLFLAQHGLLLLRIMLLKRTAESAAHQLRLELLKVYLRRPESNHRHDPSEQILSITKDMTDAPQLWGAVPAALLFYLLSLSGALLFAFWLSPPLTAYMCIVLALVLLGGRVLSRRVTESARVAREALSSLGIPARRAFARIRMLHVYSAIPRASAELEELSERVQQRHQALGVWEWWGRVFANGSEFVSLGGVLLIGGYLVVRDRLSFGSLAAYAFYVTILSQALRELSAQLPALGQAVAALERVATPLMGPSTIASAEGAVPVGGPIRTIGLSDVSFAYGDRVVFSRCTARFASGTVHIIRGPSGSGKTTLINLLLGFSIPDEGHVQINGRTLRDLSLTSFWEQVVFIDQEELIFEDTVRYNLILANPRASDAQLLTALELVNLPSEHAFLGRDAVCLSTGEKRRLSVARGILRGAAVYLLDEPTANLDDANCAIITHILETLASAAIAIVATQDPRLSALTSTEYVVVGKRLIPLHEYQSDDLLAASVGGCKE